ncbi:hypothetical protein Tco_0290249 [Tanacetum coccineum]
MSLFYFSLVRNAIDELFLPSSPVQTRWVKVVPIKVNIFSWRACRDYLPTRSNLSRRGINVVDISCPLCNEGVEEAAHIFLRCPLARGVLLRICRWWNVGYQDWRLEDKVLVPIPDSSQRPLKIENFCLDCGDPVHGLYCRRCALIRKTLEELFLQDASESSDDNTNVVNAPREPFVVIQGPGVNSSQSPPLIDHNCCYKCGDSLDGIFCQRCTCKFCGKGAHIGYNCPTQVPIISNSEPCNNQTVNELPQILQSLQQQYLLGTCQQCGCNEYDGVCFYCTVGNGTPINFSTLYSSNDSPSVANHPPQPQYVPYSCESCGNDSHYGYDCPPQVPFVYNQDPCFNQNFDYFPQTSPSFPQQYSCCENCGGPHEIFQCQPMNEDYYHEQNSCYDSNSFGFDQFQPPQYTVNHPIFNAQNDFLNSQNKLMEQMTSICDMVGQIMQKKEEEKRIVEEQASKDRYWKIPICYDDDEDYTIAITPVLSTEEPVNSLSMGDEHLDTIPRSPPDRQLRGGRDCYPGNNPASSSDVMTKSSSTSLDLFLVETNTFDNSLTEYETFCFDLEEISSGSTTTRSDYSLSNYEAFYSDDDHIKENSSGSTTTHADFSQYDSFIFDLSINPFPPADRSDFYHEEFADELAQYDCFCFKIEPELGNLTMDVVEDIFLTRVPRVYVPNVLPTHPTLDMDFILSSEPLFAYIVWIFLPFLTYPVAPPYLLSCGNEDTIFDPGISIYHSFMPGVSHRSRTFMKFNVYPNHLNESPMEILSSTCSPMDQ